MKTRRLSQARSSTSTSGMSIVMNTATNRRNIRESSAVRNMGSNSNNTASSQMVVSNNTVSVPVSVPVSTNLASIFECPVCYDYVLPPILQCKSGHLVCSDCRPKLTCCPTCRGKLENIPNLAMDKVASTVLFPCKYKDSGCSMSLLHTQKTEHEELCEHRPYTCPCPGVCCKWQGALEQVMPHIMMSHKSIPTLDGKQIAICVSIDTEVTVKWISMQSCFGHYFMLFLKKQENEYFVAVQLVGPREQAENFAYRLELARHRQRFIWEATPPSIHEGVPSDKDSPNSVSFDSTLAEAFADNGNLTIYVKISMV